jgi:hypothetical protein
MQLRDDGSQSADRGYNGAVARYRLSDVRFGFTEMVAVNSFYLRQCREPYVWYLVKVYYSWDANANRFLPGGSITTTMQHHKCTRDGIFGKSWNYLKIILRVELQTFTSKAFSSWENIHDMFLKYSDSRFHFIRNTWNEKKCYLHNSHGRS